MQRGAARVLTGCQGEGPVTYRTIGYNEECSDSDKDEAERELESLVLGEPTVKLTSSKSSKEANRPRKRRKEAYTSDDDDTDGEGNREAVDDTDDVIEEVPEVTAREASKRPAWVDEDDTKILVKDKVRLMARVPSDMCASENEQYSEHLKKRFKKIMGVPKWAEQEAERGSSDEDEMLKKVGNFVEKSASLPQTHLDIHKSPHLNQEAREKTILKSTEFHNTSQVAVVAGFSGTAAIFQVDGKTNPKIQSVRFSNFPVHCAHFSSDGKELLVGSSQHAHLFSYDMMVGRTVQTRFPKSLNVTSTKQFYVSPDRKHIVLCGRFGAVHVLDCKSKECVGTLKMNGEVRAAAFNEDGSIMYTHGGSEVYIWDMKSRRCLHRFNDHGCISGTALAASPNGQLLATGSDSGVVNVYESSALLGDRNPTPIKEIMNLTTEVTQLKFNFTSELLVMNSSHKPSGTKMVHFPSMTAFSNFPGRHDLKFPNCIDISPHSGYITIGNNVGTAYLFRLKHYPSF